MDAKSMLYLEDLHVGQRFVSGTHQMDAEQIQIFARQFDPQPFHLNAEAAKGTLFKELVASGWHTASVSMRLWTESGMNIAGGLIGAGAEISWPKPTPVGSILHVECEIIDIRTSKSRPDRGIVTVRNETRDQNGAIVQILVAKLVVPRRTAP